MPSIQGWHLVMKSSTLSECPSYELENAKDTIVVLGNFFVITTLPFPRPAIIWLSVHHLSR